MDSRPVLIYLSVMLIKKRTLALTSRKLVSWRNGHIMIKFILLMPLNLYNLKSRIDYSRYVCVQEWCKTLRSPRIAVACSLWTGGTLEIRWELKSPWDSAAPRPPELRPWRKPVTSSDRKPRVSSLRVLSKLSIPSLDSEMIVSLYGGELVEFGADAFETEGRLSRRNVRERARHMRRRCFKFPPFFRLIGFLPHWSSNARRAASSNRLPVSDSFIKSVINAH